ncbi:MAG: ATP-binding protein, partial [Bacteroidales bacterium]|nr:ATP-binding protein [Bacteroidales bacterium]
QTDLLIKRKDNIVNLCEMKFYSEEYSADKTEYRKMLKRVEDLRQKLPAKFTIHPTLVTTFGLKHNEYSGIFQKVVTLEEMTL